MIIVAGTITFDPETWPTLEAAWDGAREATLQEPGCLEYDVYPSRHEEGTVLLFERWENRASLDAHLAGPAVAQFGRALSEVDGVSVNYTIYDANPVS